MSSYSYLQIRNPKDDETPIEAATQIFASLLSGHITHFKRLWTPVKSYSFELYYISQLIYYYTSLPTERETLMKSLVASSYPSCKIQKTTDPMDIVLKTKHLAVAEMALGSHYYYPIKTYQEFGKTDPLSTMIGYLSKQSADLKIAIQILVQPATFAWQKSAFKATTKEVTDAKGVTKTTSNPEANKSLISQKAAFQGGRAAVRVLIGSQTQAELSHFLHDISGTFGSFALGEGNSFHMKKPLFGQDQMIKRMKDRSFTRFERDKQILNAQELATLWHLPGLAVSGIKNIAWGKTLKGEPPENLPIAENLTEEEKKDINFFAKTEFKNKENIFGIKSPDRGKHIYIMGKTGAGKSTLIANMAIDDIRKDRGIGIVDPHGDLCETVLDFIPKRRLNDVVYLEPFNVERPFSLNVLEIKNKQQKHLVASGIVSIFNKLYKDSWGPRLEYVLRNVVLTLLEIPNATLADVLPLLSQEGFRNRALEKVTDQVIIDFWKKEFDKMPDRMKAEVVSPIQNKVGQFVSSKMIRNIIGHPTSSISLENIMDEGKILLLNLSQGKLGEDNASLLGAMIITQIQLTAMSRAFMKEEDRRDFFLYIDEFQNFATTSFLKILSEARKYHLSLSLANQYIDQLELEIQRAIFGNVGTLMSFVVGARDAAALSKEFAGLYTENDLVSLGKHEVVLKLSIDGMTSSPFPAKTLPLPALKNDNREKIIRLSSEKYGRKIKTEEPAPQPKAEPTSPPSQLAPESTPEPQPQKQQVQTQQQPKSHPQQPKVSQSSIQHKQAQPMQQKQPVPQKPPQQNPPKKKQNEKNAGNQQDHRTAPQPPRQHPTQQQQQQQQQQQPQQPPAQKQPHQSSHRQPQQKNYTTIHLNKRS